MHPICRTCLREITDDNLLVLTEDTESVRVKTELSVCVPEIVVDIVIKPVVCFKCVHALHSAYEFKTQCLQTEERINNYIKNKDLDASFDIPLQKLTISSFQSFNSTLNKPSINSFAKPTTQDVIDDLNNLLDEALESAPKKHCEIFGNKNERAVCRDDFVDKCATEIYEISDSDDDNKSPSLQNTTTLKESSAVCVKIPDNAVNFKLEMTSTSSTQNIPQSKVKPIKKRKRKRSGFKSDYAYKTKKRNLKKHKNVNTGNNPKEKLLKCNLCNYSSASKANFSRHMWSHTGEKPYACTMCSYKGAFKDSLKRHLRRHNKNKTTDDKQFACEMCSYRGALKEHLNNHIRRIHTFTEIVKQFACEMCVFKTAYKASLDRHVERAHKYGN